MHSFLTLPPLMTTSFPEKDGYDTDSSTTSTEVINTMSEIDLYFDDYSGADCSCDSGPFGSARVPLEDPSTPKPRVSYQPTKRAHRSPSPSPSLHSRGHCHPQLNLSATIALLPDFRLRSLVASLAHKSPEFERLLRQEVLGQLPPVVTTKLNQPFHKSATRTPTSATRSRSPSGPKRGSRGMESRGERSSSTATTKSTPPRICVIDRESGSAHPVCSRCGNKSPQDQVSAKSVCRFHPGQTREETFEFLSRTPTGQSFTVLKKIPMWTCCDADAAPPTSSNGCEIALGGHTYICYEVPVTPEISVTPPTASWHID